jgi:hypothetical protein
MANEGDDWRNHPIISLGPGQGEAVVDVNADNQLVLPPGETNAQYYGQTVRDAMRAGANTGTFGMYNRAVGAGDVLLGNAPDYSTAVKAMADKEAQARERSPLAATGADVGVSLAGGAGLARAGVSSVPYLASRWGRVGTGLGNMFDTGALAGAQAAGNTYTGNPSDYIANAGEAAAWGAPFGILTPIPGAVTEGAWRGLATQRAPSGQYIPPRLAEAGRADAPGLAEIAAGTRGERAMLPDAGPALLGTGRGAVLDPVGQGQVSLINNLTARNLSSPQYVSGSTNRIFGPEPPSLLRIQRDAIQPEIDKLSPLYNAAYNQATRVDTKPLANWLDTEIINSTGEARTELKRIRADLDIEGNPGILDPNPRKLGAVRSDINALLRKDQATPGGTLQDNTRRLLNEADRQSTAELQAKVPGIRQLDSRRAELGARYDALNPDSAGSRIFHNPEGVTPTDFADRLAEASVPKGANATTQEPLYMRTAARAALARVLGTNRDDLAALERVLATPQDYNSQKLVTMFGQGPADQIAAVLRNERTARESYQQIVQGSKTATTLASQKALDAASGRLPLDASIAGLTSRGLGWAKDQIFKAQAAANRDRIAQYLAATNPRDVARNARELLAIQPSRDVSARLARTIMQGGYRGGVAGMVPKPQVEEGY